MTTEEGHKRAFSALFNNISIPFLFLLILNVIPKKLLLFFVPNISIITGQG